MRYASSFLDLVTSLFQYLIVMSVSFSRINTTSEGSDMGFRRFHGIFQIWNGSSLRVSPEHSWTSDGNRNVASREMLRLRLSGNCHFRLVSVPFME